MAFKAFLIVFIGFRNFESQDMFDFNLRALHMQLIARLNEALMPFGVLPREVTYDFTLYVFGFVAAIISFSIVRV